MKKSFLAFVLPIMLFILVMLGMGIYPFGNISLRVLDSVVQYPSFFESLKDLHMFSFSIGLGMDFYPVLTTYLFNPLNLFYLFFDKANFDLFYFLLIIFKLGLIGFCMNYLLNYGRDYRKVSLLFSTVYAFCGFVTLYYWNYQFLDACYMLPLVMVGIKKIIADDKYLFYFISLFVSIVLHYYTGFMVCVFSVIYFFFLYFLNNCSKKKIFYFFLTSLLCGFSAGFVWLPTLLSLINGRVSYFDFANFFSLNSFGSLYNLTIGSSFNHETNINFFPLYISIFVIFLVVLFFVNKRIAKRSKCLVLVVLLIYFVSLFFKPLYLFWHLFQVPQGLAGRFVFCFDAFLVLIAYESFLAIKDISRKTLFGCFLVVSMVFILGFLVKNYMVYESFVVFEDTCLIMLIVSIVLLGYYLFFGFRFRYLTYFLCFLELFMNCTWNFNVLFASINYNYIYVSSYQDDVKNLDNIFGGLSGVRSNVYSGYNMGLLYGFNSVDRYTSIFNNNENSFLKDYVVNDIASHNLKYRSDVLMDAFLGVRNVIDMDSGFNVSTNELVIDSLGFVGSSDVLSASDIVSAYNLLTHNRYGLERLSLKPTLKFINVKENDNLYELVDDSVDGKVIFEYVIDDDYVGNLDRGVDVSFVNYDDLVVKKCCDVSAIYLNDNLVSNIYRLYKNDVVRFELSIPHDIKKIVKSSIGSLSVVNYNSFKNVIDDLSLGKINSIVYNYNGFSGHFNAFDNYLLLTIPYDDNFSIYIDGNLVKYDKVLDGIIGVSVSLGEHDIVLKHRVNFLLESILLSFGNLIFFMIIRKKYDNMVDNFK